MDENIERIVKAWERLPSKHKGLYFRPPTEAGKPPSSMTFGSFIHSAIVEDGLDNYGMSATYKLNNLLNKELADIVDKYVDSLVMEDALK